MRREAAQWAGPRVSLPGAERMEGPLETRVLDVAADEPEADAVAHLGSHCLLMRQATV